MNAIKCEICGSSELLKDNGVFVCQYCGTKYSLEEARKLLGTVKIDKSDDIENLKTLASRNLQNGDYKQASAYYEQVLRELPNDPEIVFYAAYTAAKASTDTETACANLVFAFKTTIELYAKENVHDLNEKIYPLVDYIMSYCDDEALRITSSPNFNRYAATDRFEAIGDVGFDVEKILLNYFPANSPCVSKIRMSIVAFLDTLGGYCYSKQLIKQEKKRLGKQ